jgi:DNA polymerase elongation subunit (family B)
MEGKNMKILILDIETFPNGVWTWGLWKQNIAPSQVDKPQYVACWGAKWLGSKDTMYSDVRDGTKTMLKGIHKLLDQADVVVHQNGKRFDIPMLNTEFVKHGMKPPSPYKQVDLLETSKQRFRFPSNKLEYIAPALGVGHKIKQNITFELWLLCLQNDPVAWARMKRYNLQDVRLAERVYKKYLPWIANHPHYGSFGGKSESCPNCGGTHVQRRGYAVASLKRYPRFQCQNTKCGKWFRSNISIPKHKIARYVGI